MAAAQLGSSGTTGAGLEAFFLAANPFVAGGRVVCFMQMGAPLINGCNVSEVTCKPAVKIDASRPSIALFSGVASLCPHQRTPNLNTLRPAHVPQHLPACPTMVGV